MHTPFQLILAPNVGSQEVEEAWTGYLESSMCLAKFSSRKYFKRVQESLSVFHAASNCCYKKTLNTSCKFELNPSRQIENHKYLF